MWNWLAEEEWRLRWTSEVEEADGDDAGGRVNLRWKVKGETDESLLFIDWKLWFNKDDDWFWFNDDCWREEEPEVGREEGPEVGREEEPEVGRARFMDRSKFWNVDVVGLAEEKDCIGGDDLGSTTESYGPSLGTFTGAEVESQLEPEPQLEPELQLEPEVDTPTPPTAPPSGRAL